MPQRLPSLSGFGLLRVVYDRGYVPADESEKGGEWEPRYLALEGSCALLSYYDEAQLYPETCVAITSDPEENGERLDSGEMVFTMQANLSEDSFPVTVHCAVFSREIPLWKTAIEYHLRQGTAYGVGGSTASFAGIDNNNNNDNNEFADMLLLDDEQEVGVSIMLEDQQHQLSLALKGSSNAMSTEFVRGIEMPAEEKEILRLQLDCELAQAQLELYRHREVQYLEHFSKVQRKIHGVVIAESHASMAEGLAADLSNAMRQVKEEVVPLLEAKLEEAQIHVSLNRYNSILLVSHSLLSGALDC